MEAPVYPPRAGQDGEIPRARLKVFTTPKDASGQSLAPVYRLSWTNGTTLVRHVITVGEADKNQSLLSGWVVDGIEGYIYPPSIPQPTGTTAIYRWLKSSTWSWAVVPATDQTLWTARGFAANSGLLGYAFLTSAVFNDVPYGYYAQGEIEALYNLQITGGCSSNPLLYCPATNISRSQMAVFVGRALYGPAAPPTATTWLPDVANHVFRDHVMRIYNAGIMGQCPTSPGNFCPDAVLTRDEMAKILLLAKYGATYSPPTPTSATFTDVPLNHAWAPWIYQIKNEGITLGCTSTTSGVVKIVVA